MRHLVVSDVNYLPAGKILANWLTTSTFIYDSDATALDLKVLLRYEVLTKNREMIVERLTTRLLSLMKKDMQDELRQDIKNLRSQEKEGVGEGHREVPEEDD